MEFMNLIAERFSVRSFSDKKVEKEKLDRILEAAKLAPSAKNLQPLRIYVLESAQAIEKINSVCKCIFGASTVLLICYSAEECWKNPYDAAIMSGEVDAGIACTHMMLAAWSMGIGSCWVANFDNALVSASFSLEEDIKPVALLPIGYAASGAKPSERHTMYRDMDEVIKFL